MSNNYANIDENHKNTLTAYNETTGLIERLRVDPTLGYLEVYGVISDGNVPAALNNAKIDENHNSTLTGYNETTNLIECLRCGSGGELLITT